MSVETTPSTTTILIVDDNPTNIQVLFDVLNEVGYQVGIAKSGEAAFQRLQFFQPDLILLDVMMPGIDGFEVCRRLKSDSNYCDIPIIFMTALSDAVDKVKGLSLGAVDYITKPIQHEEAIARIRVHLQLREAQKALEQRTIELSDALTHLKQSQLHMVQSEKMASLGQLVAGVAHEINNPINFIYGNLSPAQQHIQDLLHGLSLYQKHCSEPPAEIQNWIEEVDLDYVKADLPKLLQSMKLGSDRIRDIVLSLRNFSRLDEAEVKAVDIHDGIESTLLILQHRFKANGQKLGIEIIKDYSELPLVECYAGKLNQVFMNILANAVDALEGQQAQEKPSQITIRTSSVGSDWVQIAIADNGSGIPEHLQKRIFEPFFTTKPVGKGTGLGMSISYQIIQETHKGKLECYSSSSQGTEFVIQIPTRQAVSENFSS